MAGALSLLSAGVIPPPVIALSAHSIATSGAVGNGVLLFSSGVMRAMVGLTTTTTFTGEWVQSGSASPSDFEVFSVYIGGSVKHAQGALFSTWHNLSASPQFLLETTGSFTLQIRRVADAALMTPQVIITLT